MAKLDFIKLVGDRYLLKNSNNKIVSKKEKDEMMKKGKKEVKGAKKTNLETIQETTTITE